MITVGMEGENDTYKQRLMMLTMNNIIMFTDSVKEPKSGKADVYMLPTQQSAAVLYEVFHESPDTVSEYITKMFINETLISTNPTGLGNVSSIVDQGRVCLEIEAVGLCGHTAKHIIQDFSCKLFT